MAQPTPEAVAFSASDGKSSPEGERIERSAMDHSVTIHPMLPGEAEAVSALEISCFPDPWSVNSLTEMFANPHAYYFTAKKDGKIIGYIGTLTVLDEGDILRIAVDPAERKQGVGTALFSALFRETPDIKIWNLEVRESNTAAVMLYRKSGFALLAKRKAYYHHPTEDALLMQVKL